MNKKVIREHVITVDGSRQLRKNCRRIGLNYYKIGNINEKESGQCYFIDGTFYIANSENSKIQWNYSDNIYTINTEGLVKGMVEPGVIGYFRPNRTDVIWIHFNKVSMMAMNENVLPEKYGYDFMDGHFKPIAEVQLSKPMSSERLKPSYYTLNSSLYGFGEDLATRIVKESWTKTLENNISEHIFDKYLKPYKYGLEIETDGGWLPEKYYYQYGALPLKDGSINGTEVTTFPYEDKIFNNTAMLFNILQRYTMVNFNNSLHVNIGNIPNTATFRAAIWILYCRLQSEIESMTPSYKRDQRYINDKRGRGKDHCKLQESLGLCRKHTFSQETVNMIDNTIRKFLNEGSSSTDFVRDGTPKWEQRTRYYSLNMLPCYFGSKENVRVEFRLHSGTVNPIKALNWMFICASIVKFAQEKYQMIIEGKEKILMEDVLEYSFLDGTPEGEFLFKYLKGYINSRTRQHIDDIETDTLYGFEFSGDPSYLFTVNGVSILNYEQHAKEGAQPRTPNRSKV